MSAAQQAALFARWWARTRDLPELWVMYTGVGAALSLGVYSTWKVYLNSEAGSYLDVNKRGDPMRQTEYQRGPGTQGGPTSVFRVASRIKYSRDGNSYNVGVWPFNNRIENKHPEGIGHSGGANI